MNKYEMLYSVVVGTICGA